MKKLFGFLLATSLTANAWLYLRAPTVSPEPAAPSPAADRRVTADTKLLPAVIQPLLALEKGDLAAVRDALRAAGVDESSIRGILEGALRARYASLGHGAAPGVRVPSLREAVRDPLRELLGVDPLDIADAEARYDFLPADKRRKMALIDLDYSDLRSRSLRAQAGSATKTELDELQLLAAERRKDVLAALTDAERAEYDLRFSQSAAMNSSRFATLGVTEAEFRALQPLLAGLSEKYYALRGAMGPERSALEQQTVDQLVAAVGYDRALDYIWGTYSGPYKSTVRVLQEANQPAANAARLLQLAAETGATAAAIHRDAALTAGQKREALLKLQQTVRPQIDALVPPAAQAKLDEKAIGWFNALGEGRYTERRPILFGDGYSSSPPIAVTGPVAGPPIVVPVPRRGGNGR